MPACMHVSMVCDGGGRVLCVGVFMCVVMCMCVHVCVFMCVTCKTNLFSLTCSLPAWQCPGADSAYPCVTELFISPSCCHLVLVDQTEHVFTLLVAGNRKGQVLTRMIIISGSVS